MSSEGETRISGTHYSIIVFDYDEFVMGKPRLE
jgi:hypothetical protein